MTKVDLLTIGETMVLVALDPEVDGGPEPADRAAVLRIGGAESNVAVAAGNFGLSVAWFSRVGSDHLGRYLVERLARRGVDVTAVRTDDTHPTGLMVKDPAPEGSRVAYYRRGSAASAMTPVDLEGLPESRVVHLTGITLALSDGCRALVDAVLDRALGSPLVSFDVNYRPALWADRQEAAGVLRGAVERADIVFVGRDEAEALWGTRTADQVRSMFPGVPHLVVKDGGGAAVEYTASGARRRSAHVISVVEPVGAGDAFAGGWLAGLLEGFAPDDRLARAHDLAARVLLSTAEMVPPVSAEGSDPMTEGAPS